MKSTDSRVVRVLYVALGLGTGGAERSVVDMVEPLKQREVELLFALKGHRSVGVERALTVSPDIATEGVGFLGWVRFLRRTIRRHRPDVIHTTLFEADVAGRLAALGTGIPVLSSIVNMSYEKSRLDDPAVSRWRLEVVRLIESITGRLLTRRFHALTNAVKAAAVQRLGYRESLIDVVPRARRPERLGVPSPARRARARKALGLDDSSTMLLSIGRQEHQKAQDDLLKALPAIAQALPEAHLYVAGRAGNSTELLRSLEEELDLHNRVTWLGHRDDIGDLLCACDVFIFPSRFEGLGGAVIEALSLGCPIVASDIPPLSEVLEGSDAQLFPQGDIEALAHAVISVALDSQLRERALESGPALMRTRYAMDEVADQMAHLYRKLAWRGTRRTQRTEPKDPNRTP